MNKDKSSADSSSKETAWGQTDNSLSKAAKGLKITDDKPDKSSKSEASPTPANTNSNNTAEANSKEKSQAAGDASQASTAAAPSATASATASTSAAAVGSGSAVESQSQSQSQTQKSPSSESTTGTARKFPKQENPPSKVVHLRNLPLPSHIPFNNGQYSSTTYHSANEDVEGDIIRKASAFGPLVDILLMRKSGQAFLQMETLEQGKKFVEEHREKPLDIGTHSVYVQYSKHQELTDIDDNPHQQTIRQRLANARKGIFERISPISNKSGSFTPHGQRHPHGLSGANWTESSPNTTNMSTPGKSSSAGDNNNSQNQSSHNNNLNNNNSATNTPSSNENSPSDQKILHVVIEKENQHNPVRIHEYYDHFLKYGKVNRIVMFKKQSGMQQKSSQQVLIEMENGLAAQTAYSQYNGKNMKPDGHTMRIDYSKLMQLQVKSDGDTRWDYDRTPRPIEDPNAIPPQAMAMPHIQFANSRVPGHAYGHPSMAGNPGNPNNQHGQNVAGTPTNNWQNPASGDMGQMNGRQMQMPGHQGSPHQNHVQSPIGNFFPNQHMQFGGQQYYQPGMPQAIPSFFHPQLQYNMGFNPADPRSFHINQQIHHSGQMQQNNAGLQNNQPMPQQDFRMPPHMMQNFPNNMGQSNVAASAVLCASNLNEDKAKPDDLFTLFGVYGDVQRVKILYEKRDTALIEFQQPQQAEVAIKNLNNKKLYGKELKLRLSKFQKVNMPKEGADTYNLTKEYLNSPLHRYRKSGSKNYLNIYEPCDVLHLSNIPEGKTEDDIKSIFEKHGTVKQFKFFKDTKMALIKVESIEEAIHCLIKTHNHRMSANQHLRVSFSKGYLT